MPLVAPFDIAPSKSGIITASYKKLMLHSAYNPVRESQQALASPLVQNATTLVFESVGIGYTVIQAAKSLPQKKIIVIEPNADFLLYAFTLVDWQAVFEVEKCVFLVNAPIDIACSLIEQSGFNQCYYFCQTSHIEHCKQYFTALHELIKRNKRKEDINFSTKSRFSLLWTKNSSLNAFDIWNMQGVNIFFDKMHLPFCVICAGPSLNSFAPYMKELERRCVLICTDTALSFCLKCNVMPDFIMLMDPQFFAYRHIAGLEAASSVLICESAVYHSAMHFHCKAKIACDSMFPMGQFFAKYQKARGTLKAGGSVATSAWDFARLSGASRVFMLALDLGFPHGLSHYKGCQSESAFLFNSSRILPQETLNERSLFSATTCYKADYAGRKLLTDNRMTLYAWWFESHAKDCATFSLTDSSLAINGIEFFNLQSLLALPDIFKEKSQYIKEILAQNASIPQSQKSYDAVRMQFLQYVKDALIFCEKSPDNLSLLLETSPIKKTLSLFYSCDILHITEGLKLIAKYL